jgi:hypothetical protein
LVALTRVLLDRRVEWLLAGSAAALAWWPGPWPYLPGDLDIVPERSAENFVRLAAVLRELAARPRHHPRWSQSPSLEACAAWRPEPPTEQNLDHLFETSFGPLDVVPRRAGLYEDLLPRCGLVVVRGLKVPVAHPEDLAATLRPAQAKHRTRSDLINAIRARAVRGEGPVGLRPPTGVERS